MKHLLLTTIAAVVLVGCGESQQSAPTPESKPVEPVAEATKPTTPPKAVTANKGADPARGTKPEPPTVKAPDISIHVAAESGNIEAVKQHLAAGTDVQDEGVWTPLHHAAGGGHKEIAELLIAKDADVNAKDFAGSTPLHVAAYNGHKEIVELLIDAGAGVNAKDVLGANKGKTPLDAANEANHPKITELLRKHGGKSGVEHSIRVAAGATGRKGNIEAVKRYLAAGTDVDARDAEDKTPLQHAVFWGNKEIVELLIAEGADVNAKDNAGTTTLDWAEKWSGRHAKTTKHKADKKEIADLLRKHGGKTGEELKAEGK